MQRQSKRARFYQHKRRQRTQVREWLRVVNHRIAVELGCAEEPWFRVALRKE
jgi:hypothetical protein